MKNRTSRPFIGSLLLVLAIALLPASFCSAQLAPDTMRYTEDSAYINDYNNDDEEADEEIMAPPTEEGASIENNEVDPATEVLPVERYIAPDSIDRMKAQPQFAYMVYLDSLLQAEQWARDHQPPPKEKSNLSTPSVLDLGLVKFICWMVALGLVGYVLFKLFLGGGIFVNYKKQPLPEVELEEAPDEKDLDKALQHALQGKDYRLAVRYLFLITLAHLGEKGILQLSTDKTNYQYAAELAGRPYADKFAGLSLVYEYVWFGNFDISEDRFAAIQQQHRQFLKEI